MNININSSRPRNLRSKLLPSYRRYLDDIKKRIVQGNIDQRVRDDLFTISIVGERGTGKTTLLEALLEDLSKDENHNFSFIYPGPIDASVVHGDLGLSAACIQKLYLKSYSDLKKIKEGSRNLSGMEQQDRLFDEVEQSYQKCFSAALQLETPHKKLARELAMSPGHFAKLLEKSERERQKVAIKFKGFVALIRELYQKVNGQNQPPTILIAIDDLDLAENQLIRSWARLLLTSYRFAEVCWIFTFDRERLTAALANKNRHTGQPDLETGKALLTKVAPFHQQWEIVSLDYQSRLKFIPISFEKKQSIGDLFQNLQLTEMLPLLPSKPRGLKSIFHWLEKNKEPKPADLLYKLSVLRGDHGFSTLFRQVDSALLAANYQWELESTMTNPSWATMIGIAENDGPLWSIPLPIGFGTETGISEPWVYLETLLDRGMNKGFLTPYQSLSRMPFTKVRLENAQIECNFTADEVDSCFETEKIRNFLPWQSWTKNGHNQMWSVTIGPGLFWQSLLGIRNPIPVDVIRQFYLPTPSITLFPHKEKGNLDVKVTIEKFLPPRLRALLLLTDALNQGPWRELEALRKFWSPLSFTRIVAATTLSAYLKCIFPGEYLSKQSQALHLTQTRTIEPLIGWNESDVQKHYKSFIKEVNSVDFFSNMPIPSSPAGIARNALAASLQEMLRLPGVTNL